MTTRGQDQALQADLAAILAEGFPGMAVEVGYSDRWNRPSITFRWAGFAALLPEERFHRLAGVIPEEFREKRMAGFVWLELAPDETVDAFLKLPRSEDVADREADIYATLVKAGFFRSLGRAMGASPRERCRGNFSRAEGLFSAKKLSAAKIRDAKLVFIRHGAYCDCQVLEAAETALAKLHAHAA